MKHAVLLGLSLLALAALAGCRTKGKGRIEYDRPLPPGQLAAAVASYHQRFSS